MALPTNMCRLLWNWWTILPRGSWPIQLLDWNFPFPIEYQIWTTRQTPTRTVYNFWRPRRNIERRRPSIHILNIWNLHITMGHTSSYLISCVPPIQWTCWACRQISKTNYPRQHNQRFTRAARALLQHCNTPLQGIGLSPAQILFHRQLRDHIPTHTEHLKLNKKWLLQAKHRERKNATFANRPNENMNLHNLPSLQVGDMVFIHDPPSTRGHKRWIRTGRVVEALPYRQYRIRMNGSGRLSLRNRKFLKINPNASNIKSAFRSNIVAPSSPPEPPSSPQSTLNHEAPPFLATPSNQPTRMPRALKQLQGFNKPGLRE